MNDEDIYIKTEAGRHEIKTRERRLQGSMRAVLLMIDGQRSISQVRTLLAATKAPSDTLEQLRAMNLIQLDAKLDTKQQTSTTSEDLQLSLQQGASTIHTPPLSFAQAITPSSKENSAANYQEVCKLMSEIVRLYLGIRGYFLQIKIDHSRTTAQLLSLLPELEAAIIKSHGIEIASDLIARIDDASRSHHSN